MTCEIVYGSARHIRPMAKRMRAAACMTLQAYGFDPRRALHKVFLESHYCCTALMDGKPVAMWGLCGPLLGDVASVWLVLSDEIAQFPLTVVKAARKELVSIMQNYREVSTTVLPDDEAAIRFALYLGFHDNHDDDDGEPMNRKQLARALVENPRYRIPIGESYVIGLGYHARER